MLHKFSVQELPGLLVEDPLGDVYKTPTREEVSRKYHKVVKVIHYMLMLMTIEHHYASQNKY